MTDVGAVAIAKYCSAREVLEFRFRSVEFLAMENWAPRALAGGTLVPSSAAHISVAAIREGVMGTQLVLRTCASFRRMLVQLL